MNTSMTFELVNGQAIPRLPRAVDHARFFTARGLAEKLGYKGAELERKTQTLIQDWLSVFGSAPEETSAEPASVLDAEESTPATPVKKLGKVRVQQQILDLMRELQYQNLNDEDLATVYDYAMMRGMDPFTELWAERRWDDWSGSNRLVVGVTIDGLRNRAERTGMYVGADKATYEEEIDPETGKKIPVSCTRTIWRKVGEERCAWTVTIYREEYFTGAQWQKDMPRVHLFKCVTAAALRDAFSQDLGKLYIKEELERMPPARSEASLAERQERRGNLAAENTRPLPERQDRAAAHDDEDDSIPSENKFILAVTDAFEVNGRARRAEIIELARQRMKGKHPVGSPRYWSAAFADVKANPKVYGLQPPASSEAC